MSESEAGAAKEKRARIFTLHFTLVVLSGLCYFTALAMLTPVLPDYVEKSLGGSSIAVGIAVGAFAVGAIALRPFAGRIGDTMGRRVLIVGGALIVAVSTACYGLVHEMWFLVVVRIATGFGEAGFFVGAATMVTDLAPADRRGEAVSYWSVAVYGGLSFGPVLGSVLHGNDSYGAAWMVSAGLAFLAAFIGLFTVEVERLTPNRRPPHLLHRSALLPGSVLFLGLIPLAGFVAFVPLYVEDLNVNAGAIFALYGVLILGVRIFAARLPDQLGGRNTGTLALILTAAGIGLIAAWPTVAGLVAGTVVFAAGMSLMYPALLLLALDGVSEAERASVVGTFSSFFDLSQGLGAFICGMVVHFTGDSGAFTTGAFCALGGLAVLGSPSGARAT
jgi:MFS family permease